jgi:hypothetical protein
MIFDKKTALQERLRAKNLDQQFRNRIEHGMGCSPFISEAICNVVKEIYLPLINSPSNIRPGQMLFTCLSLSNGPSVAIKDALMATVTLTIDGGAEDTTIRTQYGIESLRQHRIIRLCAEAHSQGGLLTVEDLAHRIFNVGERTIHRDLAILRKRNEWPALRSTVKDIGRTVTHRELLIKHWLMGDELSDLHRKYNHSLSAIENYINTFKRVVALQHQKYSVEDTAYLLKISQALVQAYRHLFCDFEKRAVAHRKKELQELLAMQQVKKTILRRRHS